MGGIECQQVFMSGNLKIMALKSVLFAVESLVKSDRNHIYSENRNAVPANAMLNYQLLIALARKHTIINELNGFADIVASQKWLLLRLLIDPIVIADVWLKITKIDTKQKITGIGKVVLRRSKAVITYMKDTRLGESRYLRGIIMLAMNVGLIKAGYWLPTISRNERIIPAFCLM